MLAGEPVSRTSTAQAGVHAFEGQWDLSRRVQEDRLLELRNPDLEGLLTDRPELQIPFSRRVGSALLHVCSADKVVLTVHHEPTLGFSSGWHLLASSGGIPLFTVRWHQMPPPRITLPTAWFPDPLPDEISVTVSLRNHSTHALVPGW
jgi:hypothetical protein